MPAKVMGPPFGDSCAKSSAGLRARRGDGTITHRPEFSTGNDWSFITGMPRRAPETESVQQARNGTTPSAAIAKRLGLRYVSRDALSIRRERRGKGWRYLNASGRVIRNPSVLRRLARLAVPPAYGAVVYASDPAAHLQAVGRDAAGR